MTTTMLERTGISWAASPDDSGLSMLRARIRAEFTEMPGLTLTLPQARRLFGLTSTQSQRLLSDLIDAGFLMRDARGTYRRRGCPRCS
jgi:hypothetical protein